jgi:holo-[acyl-carrier protein] synthase
VRVNPQPSANARRTVYESLVATSRVDAPVAGIDAVEISRITLAVERWGQRFMDRVYTQAEQDYCGTNAQRLAGRFAAKEAISKVLGTGVGYVRWQELEILPDMKGKPLVTLSGQAAALSRQLGLGEISISITHAGDLALAFAVAIRHVE